MRLIRRGLFLWLPVSILISILGCTSDEKASTEPVVAEPSIPGQVSTETVSAEQVYRSLDNGEIRLSELKGKVVFINYWAEWCSPCREEIPELNALQRDFPDQVMVMGVNFDGVVDDELRQQSKKMGIEFALLLDDPKEQLGVASSGVLPETLVIDRRGEFQQVLLGPQSLMSLQQVVASLPEEMVQDE